MFCKNCGAQLNDDAAFCPVCGSSTAEQPAPTAAPQAEYTAPVYDGAETAEIPVSEEENGENTSTMVTGIVALALATGTGLGGIIAGAIGRKKAKGLMEKYGRLQPKGSVGSKLAKAGLIVGIILTAVLAFEFVAIAILTALGAAAEFDGYGFDFAPRALLKIINLFR